MSTLREVDDQLTDHLDQCGECRSIPVSSVRVCPELARLADERDRVWRALIDSLTTRRAR